MRDWWILESGWQNIEEGTERNAGKDVFFSSNFRALQRTHDASWSTEDKLHLVSGFSWSVWKAGVTGECNDGFTVFVMACRCFVHTCLVLTAHLLLLFRAFYISVINYCYYSGLKFKSINVIHRRFRPHNIHHSCSYNLKWSKMHIYI